jgi:hypothetical protein
LELIVQTTRFFVIKVRTAPSTLLYIYLCSLRETLAHVSQSPPPPHSLISTFLPILPPAIARPLVTVSGYASLLMQVYKDGCLLIFAIGMAVVFAEFQQGVAW